MPAILIAGCSSGFGLKTARLFLGRGWRVVATMRKPDGDLLPASRDLEILQLDVTDRESIAAAVDAAGPIDVLVNNAGFGAAAPIELTDAETARALFKTNTLGTLAMIGAVLPEFRKRRSGVIINVTSSVTLRTLPLVDVYRASKAAVNALAESLAAEIGPLGVRVHIILPGASPETAFSRNAMPHLRGSDDADYAPLLQSMMAECGARDRPVTHAADVACAIWEAATDPAAPFRILAGRDALEWAGRTG